MYEVRGDLRASSFRANPSDSTDQWSNYLREQWLPGIARSDSGKIESSARIVQRRGGCTLAILEARAGYKVTHTPQDLLANKGQELILYAVTSGGGRIQEAQKEIRFSASEILLRDRNLPSVFSTDPGFSCVAMRIPMDKVELGFRRHRFANASTLPQKAPGIASLGALLREQQALKLTSIADNFSHIERAAIALFNLAAHAHMAAPLCKEEKRMADLLTLIDDNITNPDFRLVDVAEMLGISERWVRKLFADRGMAFKSHLMERRLAHAQEMLANPHLAKEKIAGIALDCGFSDQAHLTRHFTKRFGRSPGQYRIQASMTMDKTSMTNPSDVCSLTM